MMKKLLTLLVLFATLTASAKTIYFKNTNNWSKVSAYAWAHDNGDYKMFGDWPGKAMTQLSDGWYQINDNDETNKLYDGCKIIFNNNNNGSQTPNLTLPTEGKNAYAYDGSNWVAVPTFSWTLCGDASIITPSWDINATQNDFIKQEDGSWQIVIKNKDLTLANQEHYLYKAVKNHTWDISIPGGSGNEMLYFKPFNGNYDIIFTINAEETELTSSVNSNADYSISVDGGTNYYPMKVEEDGTYRVYIENVNNFKIQKNDGGTKSLVEITDVRYSEDKPNLGENCTYMLVIPADHPDSPYVYIIRSNEIITGVEDVKVCGNGSKAVKMIENGQVVIVKDGKKYNVMGQAVK